MKHVFYEVRDEDGEVLAGAFDLVSARRQAAAERREGYEVSIVRVTVEDVPLKPRAKKAGKR